MSGCLRYFDDEDLRRHCVDYVSKRGGRKFFETVFWRRKLRKEVRRYCSFAALNTSFETRQQMEAYLEKDFCRTKLQIEEKLPGKQVTSVCFPCEVGSGVAVRLAEQNNYRSCVWGIIPGQKSNFVGGDLFRICRLSNDFILRLPGQGRISFLQLIYGKIIKRICRIFC